MKKIIALVLVALAVTAVFAGCGNSKDEGKKVDLSAVMESVNSAAGISSAKKIESNDDLKLYFKVNPDDVKQFAAEQAKDIDVALIEAVDSEAAGRVAEALDGILKNKVRYATSYPAEVKAQVDKASVITNGNFVSLIIVEKVDDAVKAYKEGIK